jgi:hypothetical protein
MAVFVGVISYRFLAIIEAQGLAKPEGPAAGVSSAICRCACRIE